MILGISSYSFTWAAGVPGYLPARLLSPTDLLNKAKELGVRLVQIADNMPLHMINEDKIESLVNQAGDYNIELEAGANRMTPENLERYINIAVAINSKILRFSIDGEGYKPSLVEIISILKNAEPELRKQKIILVLENHERLFSYEFVDIIEKVGSINVGICLDCANSLGAGEGFREVVKNQWTPPEETLEKTIEKEHKWAKQSISYLRKFINDQNLIC